MLASYRSDERNEGVKDWVYKALEVKIEIVLCQSKS